jgi:hypothetical protein
VAPVHRDHPASLLRPQRLSGLGKPRSLSWHFLENPVLENRKHAVAAVERATSFAIRRLKVPIPVRRIAVHYKQMQQASADIDGGS